MAQVADPGGQAAIDDRRTDSPVGIVRGRADTEETLTAVFGVLAVRLA
jgi:hypothetical protein